MTEIYNDSNSEEMDDKLITLDNINNFNTFLDNPIYIMTVPESGVRFEFTKKNAIDAGFKNIIKFTGVYGKYINEITEAENKLGIWYKYPDDKKWNIRMGNHALSHKLSNGYRGNTLSHLLLLQKCVEENMPYIFICGDDCVFTKNFKNKCIKLWDNTPRDFDILYLGNQIGPKKNINKSAIKIDNMYIDKLPSHTTHCMLISNKGANKLLNLFKNHDFNTGLNESSYYCIDTCYILLTYDNLISVINWLQFDCSDSEYPLHEIRSNGLVYQCGDEICPTRAHIP